MRCNTCNANQPEIKDGNCIYCRFRNLEKKNAILMEAVEKIVENKYGYKLASEALEKIKQANIKGEMKW